MKCPCCQRDMSIGYLYNNDKPVQWIPDGNNPSIWRFATDASGITLKNSHSAFRRASYRAEAHYCPACRIVIAPTE